MTDTGTTHKYTEAVGRRKTSVARVRITPSGTPSVIINGKDVADYFTTDALRKAVHSPFDAVGDGTSAFSVSVHVSGGGISSQSEAVRLGIARALVLHTPETRKPLKEAGFLKRDPRAKERRKFGLRKARRAPQWSKR